MAEDINKLLNITEEKISNENLENVSISEEKYLRNIAYIVLVMGILSTIILLFSATFVTKKTGQYLSDEETVFSATGLAITIGTLIFTLALHAVLIVISNISISLKKGNNK